MELRGQGIPDTDPRIAAKLRVLRGNAVGPMVAPPTSLNGRLRQLDEAARTLAGGNRPGTAAAATGTPAAPQARNVQARALTREDVAGPFSLNPFTGERSRGRTPQEEAADALQRLTGLGGIEDQRKRLREEQIAAAQGGTFPAVQFDRDPKRAAAQEQKARRLHGLLDEFDRAVVEPAAGRGWEKSAGEYLQSIPKKGPLQMPESIQRRQLAQATAAMQGIHGWLAKRGVQLDPWEQQALGAMTRARLMEKAGHLAPTLAREFIGQLLVSELGNIAGNATSAALAPGMNHLANRLPAPVRNIAKVPVIGPVLRVTGAALNPARVAGGAVGGGVGQGLMDATDPSLSPQERARRIAEGAKAGAIFSGATGAAGEILNLRKGAAPQPPAGAPQRGYGTGARVGRSGQPYAPNILAEGAPRRTVRTGAPPAARPIPGVTPEAPLRTPATIPPAAAEDATTALAREILRSEGRELPPQQAAPRTARPVQPEAPATAPVEVPATAPTAPSRPLRRSFKAGMNDGEIVFESETQRDLYDLGAKQRSASRAGPTARPRR
jgi:hypothetical protein